MWLIPLVIQLFGVTQLSLQDLEQAALKRSGLDGVALEALHRRMRPAALLPTLRARFIRSNYFRVFDGTDALDHLTNADGWRVDVEAIWPLEQLAFSPHELDWHRQKMRLERERERLTARVRELYFTRQRLLGSGPQPPWALEEVDAELESLTGIALGKSP
jgi:hypothetical protein